MKLEEITLALVRDAIGEYLQVAYESEQQRESHKPDFDFDESEHGAALVEHFTDESHYTEDVLNHRYVLRLAMSDILT